MAVTSLSRIVFGSEIGVSLSQELRATPSEQGFPFFLKSRNPDPFVDAFLIVTAAMIDCNGDLDVHDIDMDRVTAIGFEDGASSTCTMTDVNELPGTKSVAFGEDRRV